ncbi:MAG: calcium-binding protein [Pirellulaceae bacterium]
MCRLASMSVESKRNELLESRWFHTSKCVIVTVVVLLWATCTVAQERDTKLPGAKPSSDGGSSSIPFEWHPPCDPWDGQLAYCDVINGDLIILGTADSEKIYIDVAAVDKVEPSILVFVIVKHSDGSTQHFLFDEMDILASAGIWSIEDIPGDFDPKIYVEARCGDDIVVNATETDMIADLGEGDDICSTGGGDDHIIGGPGDDIIFGGWGLDTIEGGVGRDILHGGAAADGVFGPLAEYHSAAFIADPIGKIEDGQRDILDCGQDADLDILVAEKSISSSGLEVIVDDLVNRDYNSPPGTDVILK